MFFAEKSNSVNLKAYYDLVNNLLETRDDTHKELIDKIIITTAEVSKKKGENLNTIDSGIFYIVNELYKSNKEYFASTINSKLDITEEVYSSLRAFLSTLSSHNNQNFFE